MEYFPSSFDFSFFFQGCYIAANPNTLSCYTISDQTTYGNLHLRVSTMFAVIVLKECQLIQIVTKVFIYIRLLDGLCTSCNDFLQITKCYIETSKELLRPYLRSLLELKC